MVLGCCLPEWTHRTVPARSPISGLLPGASVGEPIMLRPWTSRYSDPSTWTRACKTARSVRVYTWESGALGIRTTDQKVGGSSPFGRATRLRPWPAETPATALIRSQDVPRSSTMWERGAPMVLERHRAVWAGSVPDRADQCFCVPPGLDHGRSARRPTVDHRPLRTLLWIFTVGAATQAALRTRAARPPRQATGRTPAATPSI